MPTIFSYLDYRAFLRDWFEEAKRANSFVSYRYVGQKVGLDASFLVKVFSGQLHLSQKSLPRVIAFLKLPEREAEYFSVLVAFNKTRKSVEANMLFQKLIGLQGPQAHLLQAHEFTFFKQWYNIVIYELLRYYDFRDDYRALSRMLDPPITAEQAREAVELLLRLGLVERKDNGSYEVKDKTLSTGEKWMSEVIRGFQKQAIELAGRALDSIEPSRRDISTVTLSLSSPTYEAVCERIRQMRRELLEMARNDSELDGVYQVNFQIYPVVKNKG
jgi:uncharacterized protein (TIGR02147 family)